MRARRAFGPSGVCGACLVPRPAGGQGRPQGAGRPAGGQGGFRRPAGGGAPAQGGPSGGAQGRGGQNRRGGQNTRGAGDRRGRNIEDKENLKGLTKKQNRKGAFQKPVVKQEEKIKTITLPETITIKALAEMMKIPAAQIIKKLFLAGQVVTLNQEVDYETAEEIAVVVMTTARIRSRTKTDNLLCFLCE